MINLEVKYVETYVHKIHRTLYNFIVNNDSIDTADQSGETEVPAPLNNNQNNDRGAGDGFQVRPVTRSQRALPSGMAFSSFFF